MAEYTDNYGLIEPTYAELADIDPLNGNFETIDEIMHASQVSLADAYDLTATYNTGDVVMYQYYMYKCKEDGVTGAWDAEKWERTTAGANGSGGGGTEVVANPVGTPTADLQTIEIAGTIYDIPGGGGSGGGGASKEILYTNATNTNPATISLTNDYSNFDILSIRAFRDADSIPENSIFLTIDTQLLQINQVINILGWAGSNEFILYKLTAANELTLIMQGSGIYIREIAGVKN